MEETSMMGISLPSFTVGFVSGFGSGIFVREISRAGSSAIRPIVKSVLKTGVLIGQQTRLTLAFAQESLSDLIAEVRAEVASEIGSDGADRAVAASRARRDAPKAKSRKRRSSGAADAGETAVH
jgi:hypothetical protein